LTSTLHSSTPFRLNLEDLALRGGQKHECAYSVDVAPVVLGGVRYQVLLADGVVVAVDRVAGGFLICLTMDARVYGPCARCLKEGDFGVRAEQEEFAPTAAGGWAESESSGFIEGLSVDISGMTREALVLALPAQILCSPSCKGLCPQCGLDLNQGSCECQALEISEPMR
jgi:uncharacterized protein